MPQTGMPINNATSTELSVDARAGTNEKRRGQRGKHKRVQFGYKEQIWVKEKEREKEKIKTGK